MKFPGKVGVVTGGATGIGAATVQRWLEEGARVDVLDIKPPTIKHSALSFLECDVASAEAVRTAVESIHCREGRIDLLFANAGVHCVSRLEDTSLEDFERVLSINLKGLFYTLKYVLPIMREQGRGNIVLMGSDQCLVGKSNSAVYGLTKGAIGQLTKSTAIDYAPFNVRVNCVCPGTIDTPLYHDAVRNFANKFQLDAGGLYETFKTAQPITRIGRPEEVANLVTFLVSDESSFITGSLFSVDGGYVAQ